MSENSNKYKVHFLPNDKNIEVNEGSTVLDAAHSANIYINSICGGDGICGKCKVVLSSGTIDSPTTKLLSDEEVEKNYIIPVKLELQVIYRYLSLTKPGLKVKKSY